MPNSHRMRAALAHAAWLVSATLCQAGRAAPAGPEVVTVGVYTVAPYVVSGPAGPSGVLIDFYDHEVAPRMGVRFKWERPVTVARLEQSLINGRVMFTPILARTATRARARIRYVGKPYLHFDPCIALLPDHPLQQIDSPADLTNMTVGWVQAGALPAFMLDKRIRLDRVGSVEWTAANIEKLRLGRIDAAYFSNRYTPQYFSARTGMELKLISLPTAGIDLYGAFSPKAPPGLAERFRLAAEEAFADDKFSAYLHKGLVADALAAGAR
jgi:hypothetical protein